jgi:tRNA (guanine37-N1)-methyltransferase
MNHIDILTCQPELLSSPLNESIVKRARDRGIVQIDIHNLRDYTNDKHKKVDDYAYGGGAGMVLMIEPIDNCIQSLKMKRNYDEIIYLSPDGELFNQGMANELSMKQNLLLLAGHYKGVDERVRMHLITREISIGDYVLTGGELGAAILTDAIVRLLPGAISNESSALTDSYQDGLIAPPVYTRPEVYKEMKVPSVLLSGNEKKIEEWRFEKSVERTEKRRPYLIKKRQNK